MTFKTTKTKQKTNQKQNTKQNTRPQINIKTTTTHSNTITHMIITKPNKTDKYSTKQKQIIATQYNINKTKHHKPNNAHQNKNKDKTKHTQKIKHKHTHHTYNATVQNNNNKSSQNNTMATNRQRNTHTGN